MAKGEFSPDQAAQISRTSIKKLIVKYNDSKGQDKATLSMIIEQLARTPLYFAVQKGSDVSNAASIRFITLSTGEQVFIPIFTDPDEFGKLKDSADVVCLQPNQYFHMLVDNNCHAVINPFGSYFLMWPELVRDYLLPFQVETDALKEQKMNQ